MAWQLRVQFPGAIYHVISDPSISSRSSSVMEPMIPAPVVSPAVVRVAGVLAVDLPVKSKDVIVAARATELVEKPSIATAAIIKVCLVTFDFSITISGI